MDDSASGGGQRPPISHLTAALLWDLLTQELALRVGLLTESGRVVFANEEVAHRYLGGNLEALQGATLKELFPAELSTEMITLARRSIEIEDIVRFEGVVGGRHTIGLFVPLDETEGDERLILALGRDSILTTTGQKRERVQLACQDLGDLSALTPRELEILGLIGEGMTSQQIADRLNRSVKTIEWHRVSIGQKLRVRSRVGLARMALDAGLSGFGRPVPADDGVATEN